MDAESTECCIHRCGLDVQACMFPMGNERVQELVTCNDGKEFHLISVFNESLIKSVCEESSPDRVVRSPS